MKIDKKILVASRGVRSFISTTQLFADESDSSWREKNIHQEKDQQNPFLLFFGKYAGSKNGYELDNRSALGKFLRKSNERK